MSDCSLSVYIYEAIIEKVLVTLNWVTIPFIIVDLVKHHMEVEHNV